MATHFPVFLFVFLFFFGGLLPLSAKGEEPWWESLTDWTVKEVFLSPNKREETEIKMRIAEVQADDISKVRVYLKQKWKEGNWLKQLKEKPKETQKLIQKDLESLSILGGIKIEQDGKTVYQYGDWSDYYEDGFSYKKRRFLGQVPSFEWDQNRCFFYLKNGLGEIPVHFTFVGWETRFYAFGDDGSLRFTNDFLLDPSLRIETFQKSLERIRVDIPLSSQSEINDLKLFLVPGKPRPLYYFLFLLRLFLYGWTLYWLYFLYRLVSPPEEKSIA